MKKLFSRAKGYNMIFFTMWAVILSIFWLEQIQDISYWASTAFILSVGIPGIAISFVLSNYLLPKALRENKMIQFFVKAILSVFLYAFILGSFSMLYAYLHTRYGWDFGGMQRERSVMWEMFSSIPSALIINLSFCGLRFYYEHTILQKNHVEAQLQILQRQITPHFMFNVLNHINILMQRDVDLASSLLIKYSEILRYQLYEGSKDKILLRDEVDFLKNYIEVEQMRWSSELDVNATWAIENENTSFAPLLLIPLVENGFKHVDRGGDTKAYINIRFEQTGKTIYIEVENSHREKLASVGKSGIGLTNLKQRLDILFLNKYQLTVNNSEDRYIISLLIHIQ